MTENDSTVIELAAVLGEAIARAYLHGNVIERLDREMGLSTQGALPIPTRFSEKKLESNE